MKHAYVILVAIALLMCFSSASAQQDTLYLKDGWKFQPGDDLAWADPAFDDSKWIPFRVDKIWEDQGFDKLDRFAWYRIRFTLPSALKQRSFLKEKLRIFMGKINNFDQTFLNGELIGVNAQEVDRGTPVDTAHLKAEITMWNVERCYELYVTDRRIRWDRENVIAVRVFDAGGQGGIYTGNVNIRMKMLGDFLGTTFGERPFVVMPGGVKKTFMLKNVSGVHPLKGTFLVRAVNKLSGAEILRDERGLDLRPVTTEDVTVEIPNGDQAALVEYAFTFTDAGERIAFTEETPYVLTPAPPAMPRINGPSVTGVRPGRPFLFAIAATGQRSMRFSADNLPPGLSLDPASGIISGRAPAAGDYRVKLGAHNAKGSAEKELLIRVGDQIALTPPMGWNSWNCWGLTVDEGKVLASARVFKQKGLMEHGWSFINIDDGWEIPGDSKLPKRDDKGIIITNEKFRNMKALGDSIHALGLKFGIYSSPGCLTCGNYTGSYEYEKNDAHSYASWGIDYLKYDWCSYDKVAKDTSIPELKKPYLVMRAALDEVDRDIVYSLCQYGMGSVWEWGASVGGNLWRTTGDITDTWQSMSEIGFNQIANAPYASPGHWNDPDMLVVGWVGWGPSLHPARLTPDEQYTHISLWCMLSAPLLIGCDLTRLDEFTLNLLTNDEVLALDQDPLGKQAVPVIKEGTIQVWTKPLADGGTAIGVFNLGAEAASYSVPLEQLGLGGAVTLRDLWRQKDLGSFTGTYPARIPSHGVVLMKAGK